MARDHGSELSGDGAGGSERSGRKLRPRSRSKRRRWCRNDARHLRRDRLPPPELLPEFRFDLPELQYPERLNAAEELLKGGAPDALAVVNDHGRWTYADLDDFSGRIARLLVEEEGFIPGNRVLLRGPNSYTMFAAWLGVLKAGGVVVATMPLLRPGEIATVIDRAQISHAIVDSRFIGDFRQAVEQTHSVKHIIKYDGDYGRGELETRSRITAAAARQSTLAATTRASSPSPAARPACPRAVSSSTGTCLRRATRSRSIWWAERPATSS